MAKGNGNCGKELNLSYYTGEGIGKLHTHYGDLVLVP